MFLEFDAAVLILVFRKVIDRRAHLIYSLALWPYITFIMRVPPNLLLPPTNPPDLQLKLPNHPLKFSPLIPLTSQLVIHVLHSLEHAVLDLFEFFVFLFVFAQLLVEHLDDGVELLNFFALLGELFDEVLVLWEGEEVVGGVLEFEL